MPTYTYKREDGSVFDVEQKITDDPLTACPTTGQKVKRIISGGAGLVFKGSGFYLTDYAKNNGNETARSDETSESKEKGDDSKNTDKKEASSTSESSELTTTSKSED